MKRNIATLLTLLTVILIAATSYLIFQNQQLINQITKQTPSPSLQTTSLKEISPSPAISAEPISLSPSTTPIQVSAALTQDAIKTNVNAKNYQGLVAYMTAPKVFVALQATECCGDKTPQEATQQMSYIDSGIPFDFNQELQTIQILKSKNPSLEKSYIGISKINENLIAFSFDSENHISNIEMSASWKLYNF